MACIKITYCEINITTEVRKSSVSVKTKINMKGKRDIKNMKLKRAFNRRKIDDRKWKEKNNKYLKELQLFFDRIEEIRDTNLKQRIINQMLQCDKVLTEAAEEMFLEYYEKGYKKAKEE